MIAARAILIAILLAPAASATTPVYRCVGPHGETIFSDMPCRDSTMAVVPGDGVTDDRHGAWLNNCAATTNELHDRVAAAFETHDVNMLGGLFLWRGFSNRSAYQHMRELRELVRQPLAGLSITGTPAWQADSNTYGALPDDTSVWMLITTADPASERSSQAMDSSSGLVERRFALVERNACVWLSF